MTFRTVTIGLLRTLSIGLSSAMLLGLMWLVGVFAIPNIAESATIKEGIEQALNGIYLVVIVLSLCGSVPGITLCLAVYLKSPTAQLILVSILLCYGGAFIATFTIPLAGLFLGILLFPILLPLWIAAYIVDCRYRKKNQETPTEP